MRELILEKGAMFCEHLYTVLLSIVFHTDGVFVFLLYVSMIRM